MAEPQLATETTMIVKTLDRKQESGTKHTRTCAEFNCTERTREGKPYCPEHVGKHSYVQDILDTLDNQDKEQAAALKKGIKAISDDSLTVSEIVLVLRLQGSRTVNRLARELNLDLEVVEVYTNYLVEKGLVTESRTTRGSRTLKLSA